MPNFYVTPCTMSRFQTKDLPSEFTKFWKMRQQTMTDYINNKV